MRVGPPFSHGLLMQESFLKVSTIEVELQLFHP